MRKIILFLLGCSLMVSAVPLSSSNNEIESEFGQATRINETIINEYGEDRVRAIEPSSTIEFESQKFISNYLIKNQDGTISFDNKMEEDRKELSFVCDAEDQIVFDAYVDFVEKNTELANNFITSGLGTFDEDGNFIPAAVLEDSYSQQSFSIWDFKYNIFSGWRFCMSDSLTSIAGWAGVLVSVVNILIMIKNIFVNLKNAVKPKTFKEFAQNLLGKTADPKTIAAIDKVLAKCVSNDCPTDAILGAAWGGITIASLFLGSNPYGWIATIILTVLSLYLPSLFRGLEMGIAGFKGKSSRVNIGYWWSTYEIL